jgi:hypothetical protein
MNESQKKKFLSILMESPLYMTLSLEERRSLLERLAESYPCFEDETHDNDCEKKGNQNNAALSCVLK